MFRKIPGNSDEQQRRWAERPIHLNARHTVDLVRASAEIIGTDPRDVDEMGFMGRLFVQVTLPHRRPTTRAFVRSNGALTVRLLATDPAFGLPYGTYPRLLLAWVTEEAVRTQSPVLELGRSLSVFMARLGLQVTGGRKGTITVLRRQMDMLFRAAISWSYRGDGYGLDKQLFPFEERELWWDPKHPEQDDLLGSRLQLARAFFEEIVRRPVPVDMRALRHLASQRSSLGIDIYVWLAHRLSYLREPTEIGWASLKTQFGSDYSSTKNFRAAFLEKLKVVPAEGGLLLSPSPTSVPTRVAGRLVDMTTPKSTE